MDREPAKLQAKLRWEAACERLAFALHPRPDMPAEDLPQLDEAVRIAQHALDEIRRAFGVDSGGESHE